jgi:hypothetical protein
MNFYSSKGARRELLELIKPYTEQASRYSENYYRVLSYYSLANYPTNNFTFRKVLHYEQVGDVELLNLLKGCTEESRPFLSADVACVKDAMAKATAVKDILNGAGTAAKKVEALAVHIQVANPEELRRDLEKTGVGQD